MKSSFKAAASLAVSAVFLCTATPVEAVIYQRPIEASLARCSKLAGREKDRCQSIHNRVERLRLRQSTSTSTRGHTAREQRVLRNSNSQSNIRRVNTYDMLRLRQHDRNGGNARRMINQKDAMAREQCKNLKGTEKYQCVRSNTRTSSRGNTR